LNPENKGEMKVRVWKQNNVPIEQANNKRNHNKGGFMKMNEKFEES
jgi:hypothetical protein